MSPEPQSSQRATLGPEDTPLRAATRFAVELMAWVAVPWALWTRSVALALVAALVLVLTPATFNVPGDKQVTGVAVPGWARVLVELVLYGAAAWGVATLEGGPVGGLVAALVAGLAVVQVPRWRWMLSRRDEAPG